MAFGQQDLVRNLLAACGTFQTEINATGTDAEKKTAAKLRIHRFQALENHHPSPRGVVRFISHSSYDEGQGNWRSKATMTLEVELERDQPADTATALEDQEKEVLGKFGAIEDEIKVLQGKGEDEPGKTYIRVTNLNLLEYDMEAVEIEDDDIPDPEAGDTPKVKWWARWEVGTL